MQSNARVIVLLLALVLAIPALSLLVATPARAASGSITVNPIAFSHGTGISPTAAVVSGGNFGSGATVLFYVSTTQTFTSTSPTVGSAILTAGQTSFSAKQLVLSGGASVVVPAGNYYVAASDDGGKTFTAAARVAVMDVFITLSLDTASLTPFPDNSISFTGGGYTPEKAVNVLFDSPAGTTLRSVIATPEGTIKGEFSLPELAKGPYSIFATDTDSGLTNGVGSPFSIAPGIRATPRIIDAAAGQTLTVSGFGYGAGAKLLKDTVTVGAVGTQHAAVTVSGAGSFSVSVTTAAKITTTGFQDVREPSEAQLARNVLVSLPGFTKSQVRLEPLKSSFVAVGASKEIFLFDWPANVNLNVLMGGRVMKTVSTDAHGAAIEFVTIAAMPGTAAGRAYVVDAVNSAQGLSALTKLSLLVQSKLSVTDAAGNKNPLLKSGEAIDVVGTGFAARLSLTIRAGGLAIKSGILSDGSGGFSVRIPVTKPSPFVTGNAITVDVVAGPDTVSLAGAFVQHKQPTVLALDKRVGAKDDTVTVAGSDFAPARTFEILLNGASFTPRKTFTATSAGGIPATQKFDIPDLAQGVYEITAVPSGQPLSPVASRFLGVSKVNTVATILAAGDGAPSTALGVQAGEELEIFLLGWKSPEAISIKLAGRAGELVGAAAGPSGGAFATAAFPFIPAGTFLMFAEGTGGRLAPQNVLLTVGLTFALTPKSANLGASVVFDANGLAANRAFDLLFDNNRLITASSDDSGRLSGVFAVPEDMLAGAHAVSLVLSADNTVSVASRSFTATPAFPLEPDLEAIAGQLVHFTFETVYAAAAIVPPAFVTVLIDGVPSATLIMSNLDFPVLKGAFAMPNGDPNTVLRVTVKFVDSNATAQKSGSTGLSTIMRASGAGALISGIDLAKEFAIVKGAVGDIKVSLSELNARVVSIEGRVATIQTDLGTMKADVATIRATVADIRNGVATIQTDIGTIRADLQTLNARVSDIRAGVATIQTDIGQVRADVAAIRPVITQIQNGVATIQTDAGAIRVDVTAIRPIVTQMQLDLAQVKTDVGPLSGRVTSIDGNVATIQTDVGTIKADLSALGTLPSAVSTVLVWVIIAAVLALIGAAGSIAAVAIILRRMAK